MSKAEAKRTGQKRVKLGSSKTSSIDYGKRAKGQSKREYAAQTLGGSLDKKSGKITIKTKTKNRNKPQTNKKVQGPLLPSGAFYSKESPDSERNQAIQQYRTEQYDTKDISSSKDEKKRRKAADKYRESSGKDYTSKAPVRQTSSPMPKGWANPKPTDTRNLGANLGQVFGGARSIKDIFNNLRDNNIFGSGRRAPQENGLLDSGTDYQQNLDDFLTPPIADAPTGYGPDGQTYFNDYNPAEDGGSIFRSDFATPGTDYSRPGFVPVASASDGTEDYTDGGRGGGGSWGGVTSPIANQDYTPLSQFPELPDNTPQQSDLGNTVRDYASSGAFGSGALASANGTPSGMDKATAKYIKSLRNSTGGDYGMGDAEDWMKGQTSSIDEQIANLIQALNPQYAEQQRLGENTLGKEKTSDMNKLMSLFGAYNTADSEQRMQTQERTAGAHQDRLTEMLTQLAASKQGDIAGYQQQGIGLKGDVQNKFYDMQNQINQQKRRDQSNVDQLIYQAKRDAADRAYSQEQDAYSRSRSAASNAKKPSFAMAAQQAGAQPGGNWDAIARNLRQNYELYPGSENSAILDAMMTGQAPQQQTQPNFIELGDGRLLDKNTGDIFEA